MLLTEVAIVSYLSAIVTTASGFSFEKELLSSIIVIPVVFGTLINSSRDKV